VGGFVVDFYCAELKLAVEIDGARHDQPERRARDAHRTRALAALGVRVVRIRNSAVSRASLLELVRPFVPPLRVCGEGVRG
jgi:very-short-patch-repair endonuclease